MGVEVLSRLRELDTVDVQGVFYIPEGDTDDVPPEGVAFLLLGGESVIFTSATDWTLQVQSGTWDVLPSWCYPPEDWEYRSISDVSVRGKLHQVGEIEERVNSMGDLVGVTIRYEGYEFQIDSGDPFSVHLIAR